MASSPMQLQEFVELYDPAIQMMFLKTAGTVKEVAMDLFDKETGVTDYIRKDASFSGLSEADYLIAENGVIPEEVAFFGYTQTYTQELVGSMVAFTWMMWKFGIEKRKLEGLTNELKNSVIRKRERLLTERIVHAFDTSYTSVGISGPRQIVTTASDGLAAASAAHTRNDGGPNFSNIITSQDGTVNPPLDYAGLKAAYRTAAFIVDPRGNPMDVELDTIVVIAGSNASFKIKEIQKAISAGKIPESFSNDGSAVGNFKIVELSAIYGAGNPEFWAMVDTSKKGQGYGFRYLESEPIKLDSPNVVYKTKEVQYSAHTAFAIGLNDARSWVFSKGTGVA